MKRIEFCAGHRLVGHGGKCEFFHGHNYVAEFYVTAEKTDSVGRLIDFGDLKRLFKGWLDQYWDHGFLLSQDDHNGIEAIRNVEPAKYFVLPYNPTAENMARFLLTQVCPELLGDTGVFVTRVVIWETPHACAEAIAAETFDRRSTNGPFSRANTAELNFSGLRND